VCIPMAKFTLIRVLHEYNIICTRMSFFLRIGDVFETTLRVTWSKHNYRLVLFIYTAL